MEKNQIIKKEAKHNTITFVALVPDEEDRNGDIITKDEIIKTAHKFMENIQKIEVNIDHTEQGMEGVVFVESFVAPVDIKINKEVIPAGSWLVGMKFTSEQYEQIEKGEFVGISIEGVGRRKSI